MSTIASEGMDLHQYLAALHRRKKVAIVSATVIWMAALLYALSMRPVYQSTATILIERQDIPTELVESTVTGYIEERIQGITSRVLTHDRMLAFAQAIGAYDPENAEVDPVAVVGGMRGSIDVQLQDVETSSSRGKHDGTATVAFTVAFKGKSPEQAQQGARQLAELYLQYDRESRLEQTQASVDFLHTQAEGLRQKIARLEQRLASFKQDHVRQLPQHSEMNIRLLEQTDEKLERTDELIRQLAEREMRVRAQLASTSPYQAIYGEDRGQILQPREQLAVLRAKYLEASATYSPEHPDLERMRRQIQLLEKELGTSDDPAKALHNRLAQQRSELLRLRERYSPEHPDVLRMQMEIRSLESQLKAASSRTVEGISALAGMSPNNPIYVQLQTELDSIVTGLSAEKQKREELMNRKAEYEKRLFETPEVEREFLELSREHENTVARYREVLDKESAAEAAQRLEQEKRGQRFSLVEPPLLPTNPQPPSRQTIALLGLVLAFSGGIGSAVTAEYLDRSVRGGRGVSAVFGAPPLASIPYVEDGREIVKRRIGKSMILLLIGAAMVGIGIVGYQTWQGTQQDVVDMVPGTANPTE